MSDAATPTATTTEAPVTPVVTPAPVVPEMVTLTKEQHDQLARDAARAASNQRKADLYDRSQGAKGNGHFKSREPVAQPTPEELNAQGAAEDRKAERGLLSLAADPEYREVLDADPTLRNLFLSNPLAVLPMLAPDALDADDAISLVKEALGKLKPAPVVAPATPPVTPPAVPPVGGVNPPSKDVDESYEAARKLPNVENAIAGMIKIKAARAGNK